MFSVACPRSRLRTSLARDRFGHPVPRKSARSFSTPKLNLVLSHRLFSLLALAATASIYILLYPVNHHHTSTSPDDDDNDDDESTINNRSIAY